MGKLKIKKFFLVTSFFFSLIFHLIFFNLFVKKNSEEEILVLDLGQYQEYYRPEIIIKKNSITKNNEETEIIPKKEKIVSKKKEVDEKKIKNLIAKKPNLPEKKKTVTEKTKKESDILEKESDKQILNEKTKKKNESNFDKDFFLEKKSSNIATKNFIINEKLSAYLQKISLEINRIAHKSYPQQAIRRREEGTINSIITLDKKGELYNLEFENHRPKRLKKATEMIVKNFNFPAPPEVVLNDKGFLKIKIPVNFILR